MTNKNLRNRKKSTTSSDVFHVEEKKCDSNEYTTTTNNTNENVKINNPQDSHDKVFVIAASSSKKSSKGVDTDSVEEKGKDYATDESNRNESLGTNVQQSSNETIDTEQTPNQQQTLPTTRIQTTKRRSLVLLVVAIVLRTCLIDLPVICIFTVRQSLQLIIETSHTYLFKQMELQIFDVDKAEKDVMYYHRKCTPSAQTANDSTPLLISDGVDAIEATDKMLQHGAIVFPNLLLQSTATELRNFILEENTRSKELIYVIKNTNRWSFPLKVDQHAAVGKALDEVLNQQPKLIQTLELIMGPNPAIIEFTAITSAYGATAQHWHQDVVPDTNGAKYARTFIPSYSLFIPLQNTTAQMGATGICPGSHMCAEGPSDYCSQTGYQISGSQNNWPMGYGALVNQQTTHRGEAHSDPSAPHRVVFIITFAPRPVSDPHTVETKLLGQAGSYSLHWSHWGHTLRDFQQFRTRMKFPYRLLRSFGLYNPFKKEGWGWDYITVSSGRIAAQDVGFYQSDLDDFIDNKKGFYFLPEYLQGNYSTPYIYNKEYMYEAGTWTSFLMDTLVKCHAASSKLYFKILPITVGLVLLASLIFRNRQRSITSNVAYKVAFTTIRFLILHGAVIFASINIMDHVSNTTWARNIKSGRSFSLPAKVVLAADEFPETLPNEHDVLMFENLQSEYLYSYTAILEVFHPGNAKWNQMLQQNAGGYPKLPVSVQNQLRSSLVQWSKAYDRSRILIQNNRSNWAVADEDRGDWFCHKRLLIRSGNSQSAVLKKLDFLLSEIKFGYWRDTTMNRKHVSIFVDQFQEKIMHLSKKKLAEISNTTIFGAKSIVSIDPSPRFKSRRIAIVPSSAITDDHRIRNSFPPIPSGKEPFKGAWIQVGDIVEAAYGGDKREWYAATVTAASANYYKWNVRYSDDDEDKNLCSTCVRPFVPYHIGEKVQTRLEIAGAEYVYIPGTVTAADHLANKYSIRLDNGKMIQDTTSADMRRYYEDTDELAVNMRVATRYPGEGAWFTGRIARINSDGKTYAVAYDDGDYLPGVSRENIRILKDDDDDADEDEEEEDEDN